jgi:hypothetical protein
MQTSGTAQPIITAPNSVSVTANTVTLISNITISDTNQPHVGNCSLLISCNSGSLMANGAIGGNSSSLSLDDSFTNCQKALALLTYTGKTIGSDVVTVALWNQLGLHSSLTIPVTVVVATVIAPSNLTAGTITSTSVAFKWTAPSLAVPFGYQIQYKVHGTSTWHNVIMPTTQTIGGLASGTSYDFQVLALTSGQVSSPILIASTTTVAPSGIPGDATGVKAFRVADMMERFGVNTFSSTSSTANVWGSYPADYTTASVIGAIKWLTGSSGMTVQVREYHYSGREAWQTAWCPAIQAATGSRFTMAIGANGSVTDTKSMMAMAAASSTGSGWLKWVEGINEPNTDFGSGGISAIDTIAMQQSIATSAIGLATHVYPVTVLGPSIVFGLPYPEGYIVPPYASAAQMATVVANSSMSNAHVYPPTQIDQDDGSGRGGTLKDIVQGFKAVYGTQPIMITEWHPTLYNSNNMNLNAKYDAYYAPCFFLSAFRENIQAWFWYALFDFGSVYLSGLFPVTGGVNPRPVAYTIQAMYTLTGDTGSTRHTFAPGMLNYTVTGLPAASNGAPNSGGQTMLFQNSAGTYFLYIWNAQVTPEGAAVPVTIKFPSHAMASVKEYKISDAASSTAPTTMVQNLTNVSSMTIQLNASVRLLVITY